VALIARIISWLSRAATLLATIEAIVRLARIAWNIFLRLVRKPVRRKVSVAGFQF
jgi:hypothetical protein